MLVRKLFILRYSKRQKMLSSYLKSTWGLQHGRIVLFEQALRHKSIIGTGKYHYGQCNERLELLGDAVLDAIVTDFLYKRFPDQDEGKLTKIRSRIVNREMLANVGYSCHLDKYLECSIGVDDSIDKIVGNAFEAWIGAIYLDQGFNKVKNVIEKKFLNGWIDLEKVVENTSDFKSKLIEWVQKNKHQIRFHTQSTLNGQTSFTCNISIDGKAISTGTDRSKKRAEQRASRVACEALGL